MNTSKHPTEDTKNLLKLLKIKNHDTQYRLRMHYLYLLLYALTYMLFFGFLIFTFLGAGISYPAILLTYGFVVFIDVTTLGLSILNHNYMLETSACEQSKSLHEKIAHALDLPTENQTSTEKNTHSAFLIFVLLRIVVMIFVGVHML